MVRWVSLALASALAVDGSAAQPALLQVDARTQSEMAKIIDGCKNKIADAKRWVEMYGQKFDEWVNMGGEASEARGWLDVPWIVPETGRVLVDDLRGGQGQPNLHQSIEEMYECTRDELSDFAERVFEDPAFDASNSALGDVISEAEGEATSATEKAMTFAEQYVQTMAAKKQQANKDLGYMKTLAGLPLADGEDAGGAVPMSKVGEEDRDRVRSIQAQMANMKSLAQSGDASPDPNDQGVDVSGLPDSAIGKIRMINEMIERNQQARALTGGIFDEARAGFDKDNATARIKESLQNYIAFTGDLEPKLGALESEIGDLGDAAGAAQDESNALGEESEEERETALETAEEEGETMAQDNEGRLGDLQDTFQGDIESFTGGAESNVTDLETSAMVNASRLGGELEAARMTLAEKLERDAEHVKDQVEGQQLKVGVSEGKVEELVRSLEALRAARKEAKKTVMAFKQGIKDAGDAAITRVRDVSAQEQRLQKADFEAMLKRKVGEAETTLEGQNRAEEQRLDQDFETISGELASVAQSAKESHVAFASKARTTTKTMQENLKRAENLQQRMESGEDAVVAAWSAKQTAENGKLEAFERKVDAESGAVERTSAAAERALVSAEKAVPRALASAAADAADRMNSTRDGELEKFDRELAREVRTVQRVRVVEPATVTGAVSAVEAKLAALTAQLKDTANSTLAGWQEAQHSVSNLGSDMSKEQALTDSKVKGEFLKLESNTDQSLAHLKAETEPTLRRVEQQAEQWESNVTEMFSGVRERVNDAGSRLEESLETGHNKVESGRSELAEAKAELNQLLNRTAVELAAKQAAADAFAKSRGDAVEQMQQEEAQYEANATASAAAHGKAAAAEIDKVGNSTVASAQGQLEKNLQTLGMSSQDFLAQSSQDAEKASHESQSIESSLATAGELHDERMEAAVEGEHNLQEGISEAKDAIRSEEQSAAAHAKEAGIAASEHALRSIEASATLMNASVAGTEREAASQAQATITNLQTEEASLREEGQELQGLVKTKVNEAERAAEQKKKRVEHYADSAEAWAARVRNATAALQMTEEEFAQRFAGKMRRTGQLVALAASRGHHGVAKLLSDMAGDVTKSEASIAKGEAESASAVQDIQARTAANFSTLQNGSAAVNAELEQYGQSVSDAEGLKDQVEAETAKELDYVTGGLGSAEKATAKLVQDGEESRRGAAAQMEQENSEVFGEVDGAVGALSQLEQRVAQNVGDTVHSLEANESKVDAQLKRLLQLENYTEGAALQRVLGDSAGVLEQSEQLGHWRAVTERQAEQWRQDVQKKFSDMGEELNVADLELDKKNAELKWAEKTAAEEMQRHLGVDLGGPSDATKAQLGKVAASMAHEIAALMADESLSADERERRLKAIRAEIQKRAQSVASEDGTVALKEQSLERQLQAATSDLENTVSQLASLQQSAPKASPVELQSGLQGLKSLLGKASERMAREMPQSLLEGSDARAAEARRAVDEDRRWEKTLH